MTKIEREYNALLKMVQKYKTKQLSFEYGCITGVVSAISLVQDPENSLEKMIEIRGVAGLKKEERVLALISETNKAKYKYYPKYHVLECF